LLTKSIISRPKPSDILPSRVETFPKEIRLWLQNQGLKPFPFQEEVWKAIGEEKSGLLNAPTGSGKTYALWLGILGKLWHELDKNEGIQILWITPLRSLSKDTQKSLQKAADGLGLRLQIDLRNGDISANDKSKQKKKRPHCLIITPESIHILMSQKDNAFWFGGVKMIVVDEWHDIMGTKRGVQVELALQRIKSIVQKSGGDKPLVWAISATLPDLQQACRVLMGQSYHPETADFQLVKAEIKKEISLQTLFPASIERFPWGGRMGLPMLQEVLEVIYNSQSTLVFTNTRAQTEVWYQNLLLYGEDLAGNMAIHHSSLNLEIRRWVEESLKQNKLKVVVCTSSLDLGVDFAPVDTIIQIGSPKDISRILQRAGRSGHGPGQTSKIYFVPTHSLELVDASAVQFGVKNLIIEEKKPIQKPLDVLIQWLITLAVGDGLDLEVVKKEVLQTYSYRNLKDEEWDWILLFITKGGESLGAYDEFSKVELGNDGLYHVPNKKTALRHKLSIGTIVGNTALNIKYMGGGYLGTVEEVFFTKMKPGDVFWFGGKPLEIIKITAGEVLVKKATHGKGSIPSWGGGRMPLSSTFSALIRMKMNELATGENLDPELSELAPLVEIQKSWSAIPAEDQFLVEYFKSREGWHLCFYPFEGRYIHEILASLVAFRIASQQPISFSLAMNDYGFELLTDVVLDVEELLSMDLFSIENLEADLKQSINEAEMARRKFRDIATIAGLVFQGFPGKIQTGKHLQASSQLIYDVLQQYEPDHLLLKQAHEEVLDFSSENSRLVETLLRIQNQKIVLKRPPRPTPLSFPILVDRLRGKLSSESLDDKVERLVKQLEAVASGKKEGGRKMERNRVKEGHDLFGL
jgi:ATP-dependent Lhr-like helicase